VGEKRGPLRRGIAVKQFIARVYAGFSPAHEACRLAVENAGITALGTDIPWLFLKGDILQITWEGVYFPLDEVLQALSACLPPEAEGKIDFLDLEGWSLTRHVLLQGTKPGQPDRFSIAIRCLNHVMDHSGF